MVLDVLFCSASILSMCAMSLIKYCHIFHPYLKISQTTIIIVLWIVAIFVSSPQVFILLISGNGISKERDSLIIDLHYQIYATGLSFFLPTLIMTILYIRIYYQVSKIRKFDNRMRHVIYINTVNEKNKKNKDILESNRHILKNKALKTLLITMTCFLICWVPFFVVVVCNSIPISQIGNVSLKGGDKSLSETASMVTIMVGEYIPMYVKEIVLWLGYFNSIINPCIHIYTNKEIKKGYINILRDLKVHLLKRIGLAPGGAAETCFGSYVQRRNSFAWTERDKVAGEDMFESKRISLSSKGGKGKSCDINYLKARGSITPLLIESIKPK